MDELYIALKKIILSQTLIDKPKKTTKILGLPKKDSNGNQKILTPSRRQSKGCSPTGHTSQIVFALASRRTYDQGFAIKKVAA